MAGEHDLVEALLAGGEELIAGAEPLDLDRLTIDAVRYGALRVRRRDDVHLGAHLRGCGHAVAHLHVVGAHDAEPVECTVLVETPVLDRERRRPASVAGRGLEVAHVPGPAQREQPGLRGQGVVDGVGGAAQVVEYTVE